MLIKVFSNYPRFNLISVIIAYGLSGLIVMITIFSGPTGAEKYVSTTKKLYLISYYFLIQFELFILIYFLSCWLHDLVDLISVFLPLGLLCLFNLILFIAIIYGIYKNNKSVKQTNNQREKEFEVYKFVLGAIFICGLFFLIFYYIFYIYSFKV
jgi:hypothetical protein